MQYFLGYPGFTSDKPFDASLFGDIRKRLSIDVINGINENIVSLKTRFEESSNKQRETSSMSVVGAKKDTTSEKTDNEGSPSVSSESKPD